MKDKRGFTLIELLAVVVILGVIMLIAVPNILSTLDKNKKDSFLKDAQRMVSAAEYKLASPNVAEPTTNNIVVIALKDLPTASIEDSPYGNKYSPTKSFVAITKEKVGTNYKYKYYAHLLACTDLDCSVESRDNRALILHEVDDLGDSSRFSLVVEGSEANGELNLIKQDSRIAQKTVGDTSIAVVHYENK